MILAPLSNDIGDVASKPYPSLDFPSFKDKDLNFASGEAYGHVVQSFNEDKPMTTNKDRVAFVHELVLDKEEAATYKLLIQSFRTWDEAKHCSRGIIVDTCLSYDKASVKHNTDYLFRGLLKHITDAETTEYFALILGFRQTRFIYRDR